MNSTIKAIIVDDEPNSREMIDFLLKASKDVQVLDKCDNITQAFESIKTYNPDIVFLDIEMPGGSGFDLVQMLRETSYNPTIVFVTAYNQFAIKAIKYAAFDYLLKPIDIDDINDTLTRFREKQKNGKESIAEKPKADLLLEQLNVFQKIKFNMRNGVLFVAPDDIVWCEASGSYTVIHFHSRKDEVISVSLKDVEHLLKPYPFHRISRSAIINLKYLTKIDRRNKVCVVQKNGMIFKVTGSPQQLKLLENIWLIPKLYLSCPK